VRFFAATVEHIYIGTIGQVVAFETMGTGTVKRNL
jgi:hypothetical protein